MHGLSCNIQFVGRITGKYPFELEEYMSFIVLLRFTSLNTSNLNNYVIVIDILKDEISFGPLNAWVRYVFMVEVSTVC